MKIKCSQLKAGAIRAVSTITLIIFNFVKMNYIAKEVNNVWTQ